ncbi:conserved hypothetical protein [Methanococcus aeolicus Nankai-3]|jgi:hypothetical protein|uniref:Uncharacterized protein n=1 Tax=Methanococcus aeolicus (strain ATCC BAA-1280 / DSM 17508 / OCM 812 / Nankai-3) TaxID=419665 RepID=A6UVA6_META3|nr:DUF2100 domain-containing protein [Methanococcus aeolicus]ABR56428.1 conserved hypothetical protein [Methanococcus aeolicus Nankai-3]
MDELNNSKILLKKAVGTISKIEKSKPITTATPQLINEKSWKDAEPGVINSGELKKMMYSAIEADDYLGKTAPTHKLNKEQAEEFCKILFQTKKHIDKILKEFGFEITEGAPKLNENSLYIVGNKKTLKNLKNIEPNLNIISTEGVLEPEDMKIINPKINDKALIGIEKKCNIVKNQINDLINKVNPSTVVVVVDKNNNADELIYNSAKKHWNAIKIDIETILD